MEPQVFTISSTSSLLRTPRLDAIKNTQCPHKGLGTTRSNPPAIVRGALEKWRICLFIYFDKMQGEMKGANERHHRMKRSFRALKFQTRVSAI